MRQLSQSVSCIKPVSGRISAENGNVGDIIKGVEKFEFHQNNAKNEIENKNEFIPNAGTIEKKIRVPVFVEEGKNDYLFG